MLDYKNIIENIKVIKNNLEKSNYRNGAVLEKDIQATNNLIWNEIDNIGKSNLENLCKVHEWLVDEVCKIHESENDDENNKIFKKSLNIKNEMNKLKDEKRASNIYFFCNNDYKYYFIGDLHSDDFSLNRILAKLNFFHQICSGEKVRLIFLGDYVDRGKSHIKLLGHILILKYIFPRNIFLLKGNHDGGSINGGKVKLWVRKPEAESEEDYFLMYMNNLSNSNRTLNSSIINKYLEFFNSLCNIAFIMHKRISIMAVHGGIPRPKIEDLNFYSYIRCISDLTDESITDNIDRTIVQNILWSDPYRGVGDLREDSGRFRFTLQHFREFKKNIGFDILIRGHEAEEEGIRKHFNDKLITIFSSGRILEKGININNETAYEDVIPKMLKLNKDGEIEIITIM